MSNNRLLFLAPVAAVVLLAVVTGFLTTSSTASTLPQARPTPTPCATPQTVSGQTRAVGSGCTTLVSKAKTTLGGGGDSLGVCNDDVLAPAGTPVWGLHPSNGIVQLGQPHVLLDLIVEFCNRSDMDWPTVKFSLHGPTGREITSRLGTDFTFRFPKHSALGDYTLMIDGDFGTVSKQIKVYEYTGPRIAIYDPVMETELLELDDRGLEWVDGIGIGYVGFAPYRVIQTTLYSVRYLYDGRSQSELLDSWLFQTDGFGRYNEILHFPPDTNVANRTFLLVACDEEHCAADFVGDYGVVLATWEKFFLKDYGTHPPEPSTYGFVRCATPCREDSPREFGSVPGGTELAHFQWRYENIPIGASYTRTWRVIGKGDWVRYECAWTGPVNGTERVTLREPEGLYSGVWEVTVEVDGDEILRERVLVEGNWRYWEPAGVMRRCR